MAAFTALAVTLAACFAIRAAACALARATCTRRADCFAALAAAFVWAAARWLVLIPALLRSAVLMEWAAVFTFPLAGVLIADLSSLREMGEVSLWKEIWDSWPPDLCGEGCAALSPSLRVKDALAGEPWPSWRVFSTAFFSSWKLSRACFTRGFT